MTLAQLTVVLRSRSRHMLFVLLVAIAGASALSLLLPPIYKASTSVVLNYKGIDPVTGLAMSPQLMPGYMATQIDVIRSKNVALKVVDQLQLDTHERYRHAIAAAAEEGVTDIQAWIADDLLRNVQVIPARESSVMEIAYKSSAPAFAADVANAFATQYLRTVVELNTDPIKDVSSYFELQTGNLRQDLEAARGRLSQYQQEKGIISTNDQLDVESARLNELSAQLVAVQGELMEATARQKQATGARGNEASEVIADPLIQSLKADLAREETELASLAQRFQQEHPQYQTAEAEVGKLRAQIAAHTKATLNSISSTARMAAQRERALRAAVGKQKEEVLVMNRARDQLGVLVSDVDSAQRAYDAAMQRLSETTLAGWANQPDVAVLTRAEAPLSPWFPNLPLNIAVAAALSLLIAAVLAVLIEYLRPRIRLANDLSDLVDAPVLASFNWGESGRDARLAHVSALQKMMTNQRRIQS